MSECLFCRIVSGDIPADIVLRTDAVVAFRDINPQAPVHVLVVPTEHHADVAALASGNPALVATLLDAVAEVARAEGVEGQYRLVFNTGERSGQSVFHVHGHILGGRDMKWPPG